MILNETLNLLKALSDKSTHTYNTKHGVGENQFGVKLDDILKKELTATELDALVRSVKYARVSDMLIF